MKYLLLIAVFYPLVIPIWEKEPLDKNNMMLPSHVTHMSNAEVLEQKYFFKNMDDPRIRSQIVASLFDSTNPTAVAVLQEFLNREQNENVISDIFSAIYNLRALALPDSSLKLEHYFKHPIPSVRAHAMGLYLENRLNTESVMHYLREEDSDYVHNFLWDNISKKAQKCSLESFTAHIESSNPVARRGALYALAATCINPDSIPTLNSLATNGTHAEQSALARALSLRKNGGHRLLKTLSGNKSSIVREFVASSLPNKLRKNIHIALTKDSDWEVRRLACISLGTYPTGDNESLSCLIKMFNDPERQVRDVAENGFVKLIPNADTIDRAALLLDGTSTEIDSAIRVLGSLKSVKYGKKILNILQNTLESETIKRAVYALGQLEMKEAVETVASFARHKDVEVRKAVAFSLGRIGNKDTLDTLVALSKDSELPVVLEALKSMGISKNAYFNKRLLKAITAYSGGVSSETRSFACWSLAKIDRPNKAIINALKALSTKRVVITPMGNIYDATFSRVSACMALIDMGKNSAEAKTVAIEVVETLESGKEFFRATYIIMPDMKEYMRQAHLYMKDHQAEKEPYPFKKPLFTIRKMDK